MNRSTAFRVLFILLAFLLVSCSAEKEQKSTESDQSSQTAEVKLWNGKDFTGWEFFLSDSAVDPMNVWSVREGILHCTGVPLGYIRTDKKFQDYRLIVEWRWPEEPGNSGVLLHVQKPDKIWPHSIEAQLKSGDAGDFYLIGGATVREQDNPEKVRIPKKSESSEREPGEWNRYEILCQEDSIRLKVNDILQNTAGNASLESGYIAFQSEGKPIEFRKIELESVE